MEATNKWYEEKLLEAACVGDEEAVSKLIEKGVNVNTQHDVNGWTALHWSSKRGHQNIVSHLLNRGADRNILTTKGETAADLADRDDIVKLLGGPLQINRCEEKLPIVPNYMAYPPLNYKVDIDAGNRTASPRAKAVVNGIPSPISEQMQCKGLGVALNEEVVLKVRVAYITDPDFIEVELPSTDVTYSRLLRVCCEELGVDPTHVLRVRKLPDTIVRKDKDVRRLRNFQELELVLSNLKNLDSRFNVSPFPHSNRLLSPTSSKSNFSKCTILY